MYYQARVGTGSWISLATLGASNLRRTLVLSGIDTFEFDVTSALALTEDVSFTYNALVSIRRQTTDSLVAATDQWYFRGRVRSVPRSGQGQSEQYHVRIEGPWSWFDKTLYRQSWAEGAGSISKPRAVLFMQANGARLATGPQMQAIADVAIASGAPCTVQAITGGITPPYDEQTNITCAQALIKALSYHPHGAVWFDYSTETPVLKYGQRSALTAASISVVGQTGLSIAQRTDLQVPAIAIYYEKQNTVDGESVPQTTRDLYPVNAAPYGADVLSAVFDLRGNVVTTVSQYIKAEQFPVNYNDAAWWKARVPRLNDYTSITISGGDRLHDTNLANILVEGQKAPWMNQSFESERIQCDALCVMEDGNGNIVDKHTETVTLEVMATGCPNGETVYRALASFDPGEEIPTGIAQALYTEWAQLHFEGSLTITEDEPTGQALPGHRLNLADGRAEWATMSALVCRASEDIDNGTTSIEFGPPSWTDIDARVSFERTARSRVYAQSRSLITGASTAMGIQGPTGAQEIRDGSTNAALHINRFQDTSDLNKLINLDPAQISPAAVVTGSKEIKPRLAYIPVMDNGVLKAQQAVILCGAPSGDLTDIAGNVSSTDADIKTIADANSAGATATTKAAKADHVHADKRARTSGYTVTDISLGASPAPGTLAAYTNTWNVSSNTTGVKVSVLTRIRYSESDATPTIHFYYRTMTYDPCGRLLDVSAEGRVAVTIPVAVTIS
jgi:hypothetical protein